MEELKLSPRKKRNGRRPSERLPADHPVDEQAYESYENPNEEEQEAEEPLRVETHYDGGASPTASASSHSSNASLEIRQTEVTKRKNSRKSTASKTYSEVYSRTIHRKIVEGEDRDKDELEPTIENIARQAAIDNWRPEFGSGVQELAQPEDIPRMDVINDGFMLKPKEIYVQPAKNVYCNDNYDYIDARHFEKVEVMDPVHYEINAHDIVWLKNINQIRQLNSGELYLSLDTFCHIIRALEIDAFKNIHNHLLDSLHVVYLHEPEDDTECDVCRVPDCDPSDEMVFCDMCNTCSHMCCAGLLEVPTTEKWKCRKCELTNNPSQPCVLCPALGGAMTYDRERKQWAHISCALFMPDVLFDNEEKRAPVETFNAVSRDRMEMLCCICDTTEGACVECSHPECDQTFHVCCALRAGCTIRIQEVRDDPEHNVMRVTKCHLHSDPRNMIISERFRENRKPWLAQIEEIFFVMTNYEKLADSLKIEEIIVSDVYEYWKQKRIARKGPLIPNIHQHIRIEPEIRRVAERAGTKMDSIYNKAGISVGQLPASADFRDNQFFRPAALMVTELRQLNLKRADKIIQNEVKLLTLVEDREMFKKRHIEEQKEELEKIRKLLKSGTSHLQVLQILKVPELEIMEAQEDQAYEDLLDKLKSHKVVPLEVRPREPSAPKRKISKPLQVAVEDPAKSPLRPRNSLHGSRTITPRKDDGAPPMSPNATQNVPSKRMRTARDSRHIY